MQVTPDDVGLAVRLPLYVREHKARSAISNMLTKHRCHRAMKLDCPLAVYRLEEVLLHSLPIFLHDDEPLTAVPDVLDFQAEDFAKAQATGSQHCEHDPVLPACTSHDQSHLGARKAWRVLLPDCRDVQELLVPRHRVELFAGFFVLGA